MNNNLALEIKDRIHSLHRYTVDLNDFDPVRYLGTRSTYLSIKTDKIRNFLKVFKRSHKDLSYDKFIQILDDLYSEDVFEVKNSASFLISIYYEHRRVLDLKKLNEWLYHLNGWAEIDTMCQNNFPGKEVFSRFNEWKPLLKGFSTHKDISHRRASMVLLLKTVRSINDPQVRDLAFDNIRANRESRDILITKSISWILRTMINLYREDVRDFLSENEAVLPAIAIRETRKKLLTGKKN